MSDSDTPIDADQIARNANAPQSVTGDQGSMTTHSLRDQIEADKYRRQVAASTRRGTGAIRMFKMIPPGNG